MTAADFRPVVPAPGRAGRISPDHRGFDHGVSDHRVTDCGVAGHRVPGAADPGVGSPLTVREFLDLPPVRSGLPRVRTGVASLDRPVRWVHAAEVPTIAESLAGGEILLCTGLGISNTAAAQSRYVHELSRAGAAALVVELGSTWAVLPDALVEAAAACGLPLVELRHEVGFVAITEAAHTVLVNGRFTLMRQLEMLEHSLGDLVLAGAGAAELLAHLAGLLGNPVLLEGADGRILVHASPPGERALLEPMRVPALEPGAHVSCLLPATPALPRARLVALAQDGPLPATAQHILDRGARVVALAVVGLRHESDLVMREQEDLLGELVAGAVPAVRLRRRAQSLGLPQDAVELLPVCAGIGGGTVLSRGEWTRIAAALQETLRARRIPALVGASFWNGLHGVVALGPHHRTTASPPGATGLRAAPADHHRVLADGIARHLQRAARDAGHPELIIVVGRGGPWETLGPELGRGGQCVQASCSGGEQVPRACPTRDGRERDWWSSRELELTRLLWLGRDDGEHREFVARMLGPLLGSDPGRAELLVHTLETLCVHGGRKAETARSLHLNRQALYARIERLEELLSFDLDDPDVLFALSLAVRLRRVATPV